MLSTEKAKPLTEVPAHAPYATWRKAGKPPGAINLATIGGSLAITLLGATAAVFAVDMFTRVIFMTATGCGLLATLLHGALFLADGNTALGRRWIADQNRRIAAEAIPYSKPKRPLPPGVLEQPDEW